MNRSILILLVILTPLVSFGQLEDDYEYNREWLWGINKNSNSGLIGGVILRHSRIKKDRLFTTYGIELMNVKHPKEQKYTSQQTGTSFIWGKRNYLYVIRTQYGLEKLFYKKAPQQGVQISAGASGGLSFGFEAPYYVLTSGGEYVQYDPDLYPSLGAINGSGKIFRGIGNASLVPGLNAKTGISFEFGAFRNNVAGIEVGLMSELFVRKIIIVPTQKNRALYPSAFFTFFWGTRR